MEMIEKHYLRSTSIKQKRSIYPRFKDLCESESQICIRPHLRSSYSQ